MLKMFINEGFFLFMAIFLTVLSVGLDFYGEKMDSNFAGIGGIICLGFFAVLGKLDDTNKN